MKGIFDKKRSSIGFPPLPFRHALSMPFQRGFEGDVLMSKARTCALAFASLLCFSCGQTPAASEEPYVPTRKAYFEFRDSYQRVMKLSGDERLLETAKLEAWLQDEGYFSLSYRRNPAPFMTRFYSINREAQYAGEYRNCNLSDAVCVTEPIKRDHYLAIRAQKPKRRREVIEALEGFGYTIKDTVTVNWNVDVACSNSRGLFKGWDGDKPILDLAESCEYDEKNMDYVVRIGDYWTHDPSTGEPLMEITAKSFVESFNNSNYCKKLCKDRLPIGGIDYAGQIDVADDKLFRYNALFDSPLKGDIFNSELNYPTGVLGNVCLYLVKTASSGSTLSVREDAQDEDIIHEIKSIADGGYEFSDFLEGKVDFFYKFSNKESPAEYDEYLVPSLPIPGYLRGLQCGKGDLRSSEALNNRNFRLGLLALLEQTRTFYGGVPTPKFDKDFDCVYQGGASLSEKREWDGHSFKEGTPYADLVRAMRTTDIWKEGAAKAHFEKAKEELGASFFSEPVHVPFPFVYLSKDYPDPRSEAFFAALNEARKGYEEFFVPVKIPSKYDGDFYSQYPEKNGVIYTIDGGQAYFDDPLAQLSIFALSTSNLRTF